jgi:hypothetical protein
MESASSILERGDRGHWPRCHSLSLRQWVVSIILGAPRKHNRFSEDFSKSPLVEAGWFSSPAVDQFGGDPPARAFTRALPAS